MTNFLPLIEQFHSLQGEGYHAGKSAFFVRLAGCKEALLKIKFLYYSRLVNISGSACSSASGKPSSTLKNIGLKDDELYSNIRVTLGSINNKSEIDKFLELIQICIDKF